jgi:phospholipase/carboxylesterase
MSLTFLRRGPFDADGGEGAGPAASLLVLVHGYGANGADLMGLADALGPHMRGTVFVAPDAPEAATVNPMGFQWFPIPAYDGSDPAAAEEAMGRAADDLDAFLDERMAEEGTGPERTALLGFSQGTMMSLHVAPRRPRPLAAVVGFAGRLLSPDSLADDVVSKPPILLIHGDMDDVVPPSSMPEAAEALGAAGFEVFAHVSRGTAHGIAPDGLGVALAFLRERLGLEDMDPG